MIPIVLKNDKIINKKSTLTGSNLQNIGLLPFPAMFQSN